MKKLFKIVLATSVSMAFIITLLCSVNAASYSQTKSNNVAVYTAVYKVSETATFYASGEERWEFSGHRVSYVSGTTGKGVSSKSPTTVSHDKRGNVQYIKRKTELVLTDNNYITHSTNSTREWYFNTSQNKFVSSF